MIRRILKYFTNTAKPAPSIMDQYVGDGNIVVGRNSDLSKFSVHIFGAEKGYTNVEIGDDCMLEGSLVLYAPSSRIKIGSRTFIGGSSCLYAHENIEVGCDVMISWNCTIIDTNTHSLRSAERLNDVRDWKKGWQYKDWSVVDSKPIYIGDKSWIGFNSIIMKGTVLGEGTVVGAGSLVSKSFDPFSVIGGNPARLIKKTI